MVLKKKIIYFSLAIVLLLISFYVGGGMSLFNKWEDADLPRIDSVINEKNEQKTYSISDRIFSRNDVLTLGTKDKEYKGPVLLDQSTQVYTLSSIDKKINFIVSLDDSLQYTFGKRSKKVGDYIFTTIYSERLKKNAGGQDLQASLYRIEVPSGRSGKLTIPDAISGVRSTPVFIDQSHGFLIPDKRSIFFETKDGGNSWTERHLPPGYAGLDGLDRVYSGNVAIQPNTNDLFLSGHFLGTENKPGSSPIYHLPSDSDDVQGWREIARLEGYDINAMTFLDNGDLLILAYEGDRPKEGSDFRQPQVLRWDGEEFEHLADLGDRRLFDPKTNTNLSSDYFVTGRDGLVVINGTSFKNENGDLPVYNVTYVSYDYGRSWERLDNGTATGSVWFDKSSRYLYKTTPFSSFRKRL